MKPTNVALDRLRIDGGTHVRIEVDQATIKHYAALMRDGVKFPPLQAIKDGKSLWLWDGFHRYHAARQVGLKTFLVVVTKGTQDDAIWQALTANSTHGKPLTTADKARAITFALKLRPDLGNRAIAKHIGVSHSTVAKHRPDEKIDGSVGQVGQHSTRTGSDGRKYKTTHPPKGADDAAVNPADIPFDPPPAGAPETPDKPPTPDEPPRDMTGHEIPPDKTAIIEAFANRTTVTKWMHQVSKIKSDIIALCKAENPLTFDMPQSALEADANNFRRVISMMLPHAVCPYCAGDGCKACHSRGWTNKRVYDAAPPEMKHDAK